MVKKPRLYLDGCSMVYGVNIDPEYTLNHLFSNEFEVDNYSRGGKSNLAIAMDYYQHGHNYDWVIIGWTYAERFYMKHDDIDIDFRPGSDQSTNMALNNHKDKNFLNYVCDNFSKYFYSLSTPFYMNRLSDLLVESSSLLTTSRNQKHIFFSWQYRKVKNKVYWQSPPKEHLLPCKHLNETGMLQLYKNLQNIINEQR